MDEVKCFTIFRTDISMYYMGDYQRRFEDRWSPSIKKAKKYKRKGDASNAITLMNCHFPRTDVFLVEEFRLEKIAEYKY